MQGIEGDRQAEIFACILGVAYMGLAYFVNKRVKSASMEESEAIKRFEEATQIGMVHSVA